MLKSEFTKEVGKRIRIIRAFFDLSQKELAMKIGARQNEISRWEKGDNLINPYHLFEIANKLNIECDIFDPNKPFKFPTDN